MAKSSALTFGTKAAFTPTRGSRIGETIKKDANLLTADQRALLGDMARQVIKGAAYGKAHAHRR
jgi:hypothetical protein